MREWRDELAEIWRPIPGYGNHYEASDQGRIRVKDRYVEKRHNSGAIMRQFYPGRLLSPTRGSPQGHRKVHIGFDRKRIGVAVHRLVLLAFVGPAPVGTEACHNNGDASDNRPVNLRWDTHFENNQDRKRHGRYASGEAHHMAKLSATDVATLRALLADGYDSKELRRRFQISSSQLHRIKHGQSWNERER